MRFISWNVNGLRSCIQKGFMEFAEGSDADIIAIQEVKGSAESISAGIPGYSSYYSYADKKGYSGTAIFTRISPLSVTYGLPDDEFNHEGRIITMEFNEFYFINVYVPNSQDGLRRISFRLAFDQALREYAAGLNASKGVIITGDLNVARTPIDLKNPKTNEGHAGYSEEERSSFEKLISIGMIDSFRHFYPDMTGAYTWWSYMFHAREKNAGWRIDYFLVSNDMTDKMKGAGIMSTVMGSDHAPVFLELSDPT